MGKIKKTIDRLAIEQDHNVICISHSANGGLEIEEHCIRSESEESASFFIFNAEEKQVLLEYLLAEALGTAAKQERSRETTKS